MKFLFSDLHLCQLQKRLMIMMNLKKLNQSDLLVVLFMISAKVKVIKSEMDSVLLDYAKKVFLHSLFHYSLLLTNMKRKKNFHPLRYA